MRYELLLQPSSQKLPFDVKAVEQQIAARGGTSEGESVRRWVLTSGALALEPVLEAGQPVALALKIPLGDRTELLAEALKAAAEVAQALTLKLVDPQLSRVVNEKDEGAVTEQFQRTARYAGEMLGLPEAVTASFQPEPQGLSPTGKVVLGLIAVAIILYFVVDAIGQRL